MINHKKEGRSNMKGKERKLVILSVVVGLVLLGLGIPATAADWPTRTVQVFVWASAGGDTDLTNRTIWGIVEQQEKCTVNVANTTGALGGLAANKAWGARRDGHAVPGCSEMLHPLPVLGAHPRKSRDWDVFVIGDGPGILGVRANSPYKTFEDFVKAAKENPGKITISHCPPGCIWHVKGLLLGKYSDLKFKFLPYKGSAKAITVLMTGEVDAASSSSGEQLEYIRAGKIRPLITTESEPLEYEDIKLRAAREVNLW
jgi:tripartite-type tricarboxylate transporter receptor subunit TctC